MDKRLVPIVWNTVGSLDGRRKVSKSTNSFTPVTLRWQLAAECVTLAQHKGPHTLHRISVIIIEYWSNAARHQHHWVNASVTIEECVSSDPQNAKMHVLLPIPWACVRLSCPLQRHYSRILRLSSSSSPTVLWKKINRPFVISQSTTRLISTTFIPMQNITSHSSPFYAQTEAILSLLPCTISIWDQVRITAKNFTNTDATIRNGTVHSLLELTRLLMQFVYTWPIVREYVFLCFSHSKNETFHFLSVM